MPSWPFKKIKKLAQTENVPGPSSAGGAYSSVRLFEDGSVETIEFGWSGQVIAYYEGEPRPVPPGTRMPDPPPRPKGCAEPPQRVYQPPPPPPMVPEPEVLPEPRAPRRPA
jgi:hypothetical protein